MIKIEKDIKLNVKDRTLLIEIDTKLEDPSLGHLYISNVSIYDLDSYLVGEPIYEKVYDEPLIEDHIELTLTESLINVRSLVSNDNCHSLDMANDLIIVAVSLVPDSNWVNNYTCKDTPSVIMMHVYNKCPWFDRIIGTIKNIGCNMCEDYNLLPFINEFLRLKALDLCLLNSHYDLACKYWIKFHRNSNMGCGCNSNPTPTQEESSSTETNGSSTVIGCGCHG